MEADSADARQQTPVSAPKDSEVTSSRLPWIDLIRAGGAFLVVLAHVILYPALRGAGPLWAQALYYTASRIAVPLFFMASGYLLLGKSESYGAFFRKRALRVVAPFLIWSLVYYAWNGGFSDGPLTLGAVGEALLRILRGPRAAHLWFFYVLISLYLFTPILRIFTLNARVRDVAYFCGLWFLLDPMLQLVRYLTGVQIGFEFLFLTGYIGYFMLGHLLGMIKATRLQLVISAAALAASFGIVFWSVFRGMQLPEYDQFLEGYLSAPVVVMTAAAFLLIASAGPLLGARSAGWVRNLSRASLGIYLVHVLVLDLLDMALVRWTGSPPIGSSILAMPFFAVVGYFICLLIVMLLQRIPVVRYAVP